MFPGKFCEIFNAFSCRTPLVAPSSYQREKKFPKYNHYLRNNVHGEDEICSLLNQFQGFRFRFKFRVKYLRLDFIYTKLESPIYYHTDVQENFILLSDQNLYKHL